MNSAGRVWALNLAATAVAGLATVAALLVALSQVEYRLPSPAELAAACERYALPDLHSVSLLVVVVGSLSLAAGALTLRSVARQLKAGARFERGLAVLGPVPGGARRAFVIDDDAPLAFCVGLLSPRIYVSRGALGLLGREERAAVFAHELHHARRRDPLRLLVTHALADGLFFVPGVRRLPERCAAIGDLAADAAAARGPGGRRALASALLAFDEHPSQAATGIAPDRVEQLLGRRPCWKRPSLLLLATVVTTAGIVAITARMAGAAAAGPVTLPALAAQACMLVMSVGPLLLAGVVVCGGRRLLRSRGMLTARPRI